MNDSARKDRVRKAYERLGRVRSHILDRCGTDGLCLAELDAYVAVVEARRAKGKE